MQADTFHDDLVISTHTLTWSVTYTTGAGTAIIFNFNSHAHVERDLNLFTIIQTTAISTHTLTWSVTRFLVE